MCLGQQLENQTPRHPSAAVPNASSVVLSWEDSFPLGPVVLSHRAVVRPACPSGDTEARNSKRRTMPANMFAKVHGSRPVHASQPASRAAGASRLMMLPPYGKLQCRHPPVRPRPYENPIRLLPAGRFIGGKAATRQPMRFLPAKVHDVGAHRRRQYLMRDAQMQSSDPPKRLIHPTAATYGDGCR